MSTLHVCGLHSHLEWIVQRTTSGSTNWVGEQWRWLAGRSHLGYKRYAMFCMNFTAALLTPPQIPFLCPPTSLQRTPIQYVFILYSTVVWLSLLERLCFNLHATRRWPLTTISKTTLHLHGHCPPMQPSRGRWKASKQPLTRQWLSVHGIIPGAEFSISCARSLTQFEWVVFTFKCFPSKLTTYA